MNVLRLMYRKLILKSIKTVQKTCNIKVNKTFGLKHLKENH